MEIIAEGLGIILSLDEHTGALIIGTQAHTITMGTKAEAEKPFTYDPDAPLKLA